ncbi:hypothetical protein [Micromonospora aurantiaca (nom. illeg.)]|uniref:hypothetical protein n=1 Tax=Micromonospora aurantiaca (nom. illeg.) TaxID=47850 RepID=UPI0033FF2958
MSTKRYRDLGSGDQIVTEEGFWDRVHGVNHEDAAPGKVLVSTDSKRDAEYDADAIVEVV